MFKHFSFALYHSNLFAGINLFNLHNNLGGRYYFCCHLHYYPCHSWQGAEPRCRGWHSRSISALLCCFSARQTPGPRGRPTLTEAEPQILWLTHYWKRKTPDHSSCSDELAISRSLLHRDTWVKLSLFNEFHRTIHFQLEMATSWFSLLFKTRTIAQLY